ncbi:Got1/Sft2-like family protein [Babesia bovis T2Bo]|uniref:CGI-141 protein-like protein, putative n=1 Tax=Babesia bovis TaxID=5865 RepID=A7ATT9_BABBO|nr:Got1/Sft2-like family protein [Babesia bovis T2Bo]EDO06350.1 Got1/Sft2-like family protein [Babesia bovis T2Bo]BAN64233.1 CGI-141 protein-like protein, putative [Babesia bovis]|eukprot:XP_001609918.1 CGI-141 protein-like protein [Babesia bovis T2Bo]
MERNLRLGFALLCLGFITGSVSILLLFDRFFLNVSNVFVVSGLYCILGTRKFIAFFTSTSRIKGTIIYFLGILGVICGWSKIGFIFETYGVYLLFGAFLPNIISYIRVTPFNFVLDLPVIKTVVAYLQEKSSLPL